MIKIHRDNRVIFWLLIGGIVLNILWSLRLELQAQGTKTIVEKYHLMLNSNKDEIEGLQKFFRSADKILIQTGGNNYLSGNNDDWVLNKGDNGILIGGGGSRTQSLQLYSGGLYGVGPKIYLYQGGIDIFTDNDSFFTIKNDSMTLRQKGEISIESPTSNVQINARTIRLQAEDFIMLYGKKGVQIVSDTGDLSVSTKKMTFIKAAESTPSGKPLQEAKPLPSGPSKESKPILSGPPKESKPIPSGSSKSSGGSTEDEEEEEFVQQ